MNEVLNMQENENRMPIIGDETLNVREERD